MWAPEEPIDVTPYVRPSAPAKTLAAVGALLAALPMQPSCGASGYAYDQIMSSPIRSMKLPKVKKNVNRPPGARKKKR